LDGWPAVVGYPDPVDRLLALAIADQLIEERERERHALAVEIVNVLGKAIK